MTRALVLSILLLVISTVEVSSQVTVTYDAVVEVSIGPNSAAFPAGERVVISYTLNTAAVDTDADPQRGTYDNAVLSMSVSFPGLEKYINAGPQITPYDAAAFVSNDIVAPSGTSISDVVYFLSGPVTSASPIDGASITGVEVELGNFVPAPANPALLTSDALPLGNLATPFSYLHIWTTSGGTTLRFAQTAPIAVGYDAIVTAATGEHAGLFQVGEQLRLDYAFSAIALDRNSDPAFGHFFNGLLSLSVVFPRTGIFAGSGPPASPFDGQVFTTNDFLQPSGRWTDQISIWNGPMLTASRLDGVPMTSMVVGIQEFPAGTAMATMLSGDDLPIHIMRGNVTYFIFRTSTGSTFVHFALAPSVQVGLLIGDVEALVDDGSLPPDDADRLIRSLESAAASLAKGNTGSVCSHLRGFVRRVEDEVESGGLSADEGQRLIDRAQAIQQLIGC